MLRSLASLLIFCAVLLAAQNAAALPPGWEVISSSAERLILRIEVPEPRLSEVEEEGRSYTRLQVPGYVDAGENGFPMLPARGGWVGLPPEGNASLNVRVLQREPLDPARILPYPTPVLVERRATELRSSDEAFQEAAEYGTFSQGEDGIARLGVAVWSRKQRMVPLQVSPILYDAASGRLEWIRSLEIVVDLPREPVGFIPEDGRPDAVALSLLLNPREAAAWRSLSPRHRNLRRARELSLGATKAVQPGGLLPMDQVTLLTDEFRIPVAKTGLMGVHLADLFNDHAFPAGIRRDQLRLYQKRATAVDDPGYPIPVSIEVPLHFFGSPDPSGDVASSDIVIFWGLGCRDDEGARVIGADTIPPAMVYPPDNFNNFNVYYLAGADPGVDSWARMESVSFAPAGPSPRTAFDLVETFEEDVYYQPNPILSTERQYHWNNWRDTSVRRPITLRPLEASSSIDVSWTMVSSLHQRVDLDGDPSVMDIPPILNVSLEDEQRATWPLGLYDMNPSLFNTLQPRSVTVDAGALQAGTLIMAMISDPMPGVASVFGMLGKISLSYRALYEATSNELTFNTDQVGGTADLVIDGFTTTLLFMVEITDPYAPRFVSLAAENILTSGNTSISVQVPQAAGEQRVFQALWNAKIASVSSSEISSTSTPILTAALNSPQVLVIGPDAFEVAMQPWFDWRRQHDQHGWTFAYVDVADVYDQFSGGLKSPHAIKALMEIAYVDWDAKALLLVGDANEDSRRLVRDGSEILGTEDIVTSNYHMQDYDDYEALASDKWFVTFGINEDRYPLFLNKGPDMLVGRLPVVNAAEIATHIDKITTYETPRADDAWRQRVLWMADDPYSTGLLGGAQSNSYVRGAGEDLFTVFQGDNADQTSAFLDNVMDGELWDLDDFTLTIRGGSEQSYPIGMLATVLRAVATTLVPSLRLSLSEGALMVSYQGHAAYNVLAHEKILQETVGGVKDISALTNHGRPFVFFGMGCHISDFVQPRELRLGRSIGENFFHHPTGGSIATYGSSGFEFLTPNGAFMEVIGEAFFETPARAGAVLDGASHAQWILGDVLAQAENDIFAVWSLKTREMVAQYTLLGDPLLRLDATVPRLNVRADGSDLSEGADLIPAQGARIAAMVFDAIDESGVDRIEVTDSRGGDYSAQLIYEQGAGLDARVRRATLDLPIVAAGYPDGYEIDVEVYDRAYPRERPTSFSLHVPFELAVLIDGTELGPEGYAVGQNETASFALDFTSPIGLLENEIELSTPGLNLVGGLQKNSQDPDARIWSVQFDATSDGSGSAQTLTLTLAGAVTSVDLAAQPEAAELAIADHFVFPNPANPETGPVRIVTQLNQSVDWARITVYDLSGRIVTSQTENVASGTEIVLSWDGRDRRGDVIANGTYLYRVEVGGPGGTARDMGRLVLMR